MEPMSRREAAEKGLFKYFPSRPCARGHLTLRYVKTGACTACTRTYGQRMSKLQAEAINAQRTPDHELVATEKALILRYRGLKESSRRQLLEFAGALKMAEALNVEATIKEELK